MVSNTKALLEELYTLEPSLRDKEEIILRIITSMQQNQPEVLIDENFKNELREKVMSELKNTKISNWQSKKSSKSWNMGWVFVGLSTGILASFFILSFSGWMIPFSSHPTQENPAISRMQKAQSLSFAPVITSTGKNGFGNATNLTLWASLATSPTMGVTPGATGMRGEMTSKRMMVDTMPAQDFPYYTYSYTGSLPAFSGNLTVYKKNPAPFAPSETQAFLQGLSLEGLNLQSFENTSITSLSFAEAKDYGYIVNIDFAAGSIGFYQNWMKWPQPKCGPNGCEQSVALTEKDVPSDEEFVRIGDTFLTQYGIDRSLYGAPKVDGSWRIMYALARSTNLESTIPDQYTLTYPLTLEWKKIYEEYGWYKGISLSIDIRTKRVTSLSGIEKQNITSSIYTTQTDEANILKMIPFGGRYESKANPDQKVVNLTLGEPTIEYVHIYGEWKDNKADEYYVPAYVFPVINKPEGSYIQDNVILPLVQDFATFVPLSE